MGWRLWRTTLSNGRYIVSGDEAGMDLVQGRIRTLRTSFELMSMNLPASLSEARVASIADHMIIKFSGSEF